MEDQGDRTIALRKRLRARKSDGTELTLEEQVDFELLRLAGCTCTMPLFGQHYDYDTQEWLPRCRLCATFVYREKLP